MSLLKPVFVVAVACCMAVGTPVVASSQEPAGALTISKTCPSGVTGTARFLVSLINSPEPGVPVDVSCGGSSVVPLPPAFVVGAAVTIVEIVMPAGTAGSFPVQAILGPGAETVPIQNFAAAGALSIHKTCAPGVSGSAIFIASGTFENVPWAGSGSVSVACGATKQLFAAAALPVGAVVSIQETIPATGGIVATIPPVTVTGADQTMEVNNAAAAVPAGALMIQKTCAEGVTGNAVFAVSAPAPTGTGSVSADVPVACGATATVPTSGTLAGALVVGAPVTIMETSVPTGGVAATPETITLSADARTVTINNAAARIPAGALNILKTCAAGVTGSAAFSVVAPAPVGTGTVSANVTVPCGATVAVPTAGALAGALVVGAPVTITETTAPTGGMAAAPQTITLSADARTVTINNLAAPAGALRIHKTCAEELTGDAGNPVFTVSAPSPTGIGTVSTSLTVGCGETVTVPTTGALAGALLVGVPVTITETSAPEGTVAVAPQTVTLTLDAQTITINNGLRAGALKIAKHCAGGVTGSAVFSVAAPNPAGTGNVSANVTVPCGETVTVPATTGALAGALVVGAPVTITETSAPPGALAAAARTVTLTDDARTVAITNVPVPSPPVPGVLSLHKTCADEVSGTATFTVTATPSGGSLITSMVSVPCGSTVSVPLPALTSLLGATATIHETTPPAGGSAAADTTAILTSAAQTITINNVAAAAGALTLQKTCGTGVSGSATFAVTITRPGENAVTVPLTLACGQTITVPLPVAAAFAGTVVTFHETVPATGGVVAADVTTTVLGTAQTITINNVSASAAGVLGASRLPQTGDAPGRGLALLSLALGALLIALGRLLWVCRAG